MPTYDYRCNSCGHAFERFHSITAAPISKCPKCTKRKVRRLLGTGGGVIFKGSGFYTTDYRSESYKSAAKADSGASGPATSTSKSAEDTPAPKESKPAAKAQTPSNPKK